MTRRQTASIVFVVLCVVLVAAAVTLNIGWIMVNGRRLAPLLLGVATFSLIIAGLIVYTVFLVREMGITEQQDSFLNSVTHELKTPIASIRLYLETLESREVGDAQRKEFYRIMLQDADRLQHTVEQVLRAGVARQRRKLEQRHPISNRRRSGTGAHGFEPTGERIYRKRIFRAQVSSDVRNDLQAFAKARVAIADLKESRLEGRDANLIHLLTLRLRASGVTNARQRSRPFRRRTPRAG